MTPTIGVMMKKYKINRKYEHLGMTFTIHADSEKEALEKRVRKEFEIETGGKFLHPKITLEQWTYRCIETYKIKQCEATRKAYMRRIKHCIIKNIGHLHLEDVKPMHCQDCLNLQIGKSKTQINEVYQSLRFIFKHAVANELISKDPTLHIVKPEGSINHRRALTKKERIAFIEVGKSDRRYFFYLLMIYCGCRPSEAAECKRYDIKTMDGYHMLHIRGTKTKNSDRLVPVPQELYDLIRDIKPDEYIALLTNGNKIPSDPSGRARLWKSYTRAINIFMGCKTYRNALVPPYPLAQDLVAYCLRHEFCTDLARRGIDIRIAQKLMGHSDIKLTANIYTNLDNDDLINAAALLNTSRVHDCINDKIVSI